MRKILFTLSVITTLMACSKSDDKPSHTMVFGVKDAWLHIYPSYESWKNDDTTKALFSGVTDAEGMVKVPNQGSGKIWLYMDINKENNKYNTWGVDSFKFESLAGGNYMAFSEGPLADPQEWTRNLIGTPGKRPSYKMVDQLMFNGSTYISTWSSLSDCDKQHTLTFTKDYVMTDKPAACSTDGTLTGTFVRFNGKKEQPTIDVTPASSTVSALSFAIDKSGAKPKINVYLTVGTAKQLRVFEQQ